MSRPGTRSCCRRARRPQMVAKLNAAVSKALDNPQLRARFDAIGLIAAAPERRSPEYLRTVHQRRSREMGEAGEGERRAGGLSSGYGLKPVPPQRWHFIFLSPFLIRPLPSQFLHFSFFLPLFFCMSPSPSTR